MYDSMLARVAAKEDFVGRKTWMCWRSSLERYLPSGLSLSLLRFEVGSGLPGWVDVDNDDGVGDSR